MKNRTHSWLRFAQGFWLLVTPLINAADVSSYSISKGIYYEQTGTGMPTALTNNGYAFDAQVNLRADGTASGAQVLTPASGTQVLTVDGDTLEYKKKYNTPTKLDSNYPEGVYSLSINTAHEGTRTVTLDLAGPAFPNAPHLANYGEAQAVNANGWFLARWDRFAGGYTGDFVQLRIEDSTGNKIFETPDLGENGALDGTAIFALVPPGTLKASKTYAATLTFQRIVARNDYDYPGALGIAYYFTRTSFPLVTSSQGSPDVESCIVTKGSSYEQTNDWSRSPESGSEFIFDGKVNGASSTAIVSSTLLTPGGTTLIPADNGTDWEYQDDASTADSLGSKYPIGTYQFNLNLLRDGIRQPAVNFIECPFPPAPRLGSFDPSQKVRADRDLLIAWDSWNEGTWYDLIQVRIEDDSNNKIFETPDFGEKHALDGRATSAMVPAGTLLAGQAYKARIVFTKLVAIDSSAYPGVLVMATYYTRTKFDLTTMPTDVKTFSIAKGHDFIQRTSAPPSLNSSAGYVFTASVVMNDSNTVTGASILTPSGVRIPLQYQGDGATWLFRDAGSNQSTMDATYPDGSYTLTMATVHDGTRSIPLAVNGYLYPNSPHISNFSNAQSVNPTNSFTVHWDVFASGTTNDYIYEKVTDSTGQIADDSKGFGKSSALNGTDQSAKIGSGKLVAASLYQGSVMFEKILQVDATNYPGALGYSGLFSRTVFPIITTGPGNPPAFTKCVLNPAGKMELTFSSIPGMTYQILSSTNLVNWAPITTVSPSASATTWTETSNANLKNCFYRAVTVAQ
jgi:hypothetical protein